MGGNGLFTFTPPDLDDFAWINQETATAVQNGDTIFMTAPGVTGNHIRVLKKALPAAPCTVTAWLTHIMPMYQWTQLGITLRESASGKLASMVVYTSTSGTTAMVNCSTYPSPTDNATLKAQFYIPPYCPVGLRIRITAGSPGTRYFEISTDGLNWWTVYSVANNDYITPNEIGLFMNSTENTAPTMMSLLSWAES